MSEIKDRIRQIIIDEGGDGSEYAVEEIVRLFDQPSDKQARKHHMTGYLVDLLKVAVRQVHETGRNDFKAGDIADALITNYGPAAYNNFKHLRYFGLIAKQTDAEGRKIRRWLVTHKGAEFLRGEAKIRAWVTIKDNTIQERSEGWVGVRDVGGIPMETRFEYFDDANQPAGLRPAFNEEGQAKLV